MHAADATISQPLHRFAFPFLNRIAEHASIRRVMITMIVPDDMPLGELQDVPFSPYRVVFSMQTKQGAGQDPVWIHSVIHELKGIEITVIVTPYRQTDEVRFGLVLDLEQAIDHTELDQMMRDAFRGGHLDSIMIARQPPFAGESTMDGDGFACVLESFRTLIDGNLVKFYFHLPRMGAAQLQHLES